MRNAVVIVTGAGRGIGRATAELFAGEGARVVLCARTGRELRATCSAIRAAGGEAVARVADIGSARQARALVDLALRRYGRLDLLINNAGILGPRVPLARYPHRDWAAVLRINLSGTFYMMQEAARSMARRRSGCIITLSSSVGRTGRAGWGAYAVSKFGVEGLSQVLADELRPSHVCAITFNPGGTRTAMRAAAYPREDRGALRDPSVAARALLHLATCASPAISGRAFDLDNLPSRIPAHPSDIRAPNRAPVSLTNRKTKC
jgi:NAD(P)-dependent dehydrogenase (short-subunit alcohol dehydrogenase family)